MDRSVIRCGVLVSILGAVIVNAEGSQRAAFGRPAATAAGGTVFSGQADRHQLSGQTHVYEGNVVLTFSNSQLVIRADRATWNGTAISLDGNVRVNLDAQ